MSDRHEIMLPTQHARAALQMLANSPGLVEQVLEGSGVTLDGLANFRFSFPLSAFWRIADNLAQLFGPGWFLRLPVLWSIEVQSEFGMAVRSAPNLAVAVDVLVRFADVRWQIGRVDAVRGATTTRLDFLPLVILTPAHHQLIASLAALNFQTTVRGVIGDDVSRLHFRLRGPPPAFESALRELFAGEVTWGGERTGVIIPNDLLERPSNLASEGTFNTMVNSLREMAANRKQMRTTSGQVRDLLDSTIRGQMDALTAAGRLGLSRRTMERRLQEEGVSFRKLQEDSLGRRLLALVRDRALSLPEMAALLGYSDTASLQRACRRLFGKSLLALRRDEAGSAG